MLETLLLLGSGIFWTATYVLIIRRGFLDRTYAMPLAALCANISWEFIFSFIHPSGGVQEAVNIAWLVLDAVIFYTLLRFGPAEFPGMPRRVFYGAVALGIATSVGLVSLISAQFDNWIGAYAAFGQNLMMSALFMAMLYQRHGMRGQSVAIGICKLLGTAFASLQFYYYPEGAPQNALLNFLFVANFIFDVIYVGALIYVQRHTAAEPAAVRVTPVVPMVPSPQAAPG